MQVMLSITKSVLFQGNTEEFSNVYTYDGVSDDDSAVESLVDAVVAAERPIFSGAVRFVRAKAWKVAGLGPNVMRITKDLSGNGGATTGASMYPELAVMVRWSLPSRTTAFLSSDNAVRRVSRYLRKYLHTCTPHNLAIDAGGSGSTPAATSPLTAYANAVRAPLNGVNLCAPNGDQPSGSHRFHPYLEHRQFPRGRKES